MVIQVKFSRKCISSFMFVYAKLSIWYNIAGCVRRKANPILELSVWCVCIFYIYIYIIFVRNQICLIYFILFHEINIKIKFTGIRKRYFDETSEYLWSNFDFCQVICLSVSMIVKYPHFVPFLQSCAIQPNLTHWQSILWGKGV